MAEDRVRGDAEEADRSEETDEVDRSEGTEQVDVGEPTAPSIGPNTVIEREDPEERLARHEQSEQDAMGLDKRREVIGGRYSPTLARQLTMYGIFVAVVAAIGIGLFVLVSDLDRPPKNYPDKAPWAQADAPNVKPPPLDFPTYGNPGPRPE
jgi:hypothetical protein